MPLCSIETSVNFIRF